MTFKTANLQKRRIRASLGQMLSKVRNPIWMSLIFTRTQEEFFLIVSERFRKGPKQLDLDFCMETPHKCTNVFMFSDVCIKSAAM